MLNVALCFTSTVVKSGKDLRNHLLASSFSTVEEDVVHALSTVMQLNKGGVRTRPNLIHLHPSNTLFTMSDTLLL